MAHIWIIYARLSAFDGFQDTIVVMISKVTIYCDGDSTTALDLAAVQHKSTRACGTAILLMHG